MKKLSVQLAISHIFPLLILAPILGLTLLYLWENYYFLDELAGELVVQARIIADFSSQDGEIWQSPSAAGKFIAHANLNIPARLMLLNNNGLLLYSSMASDRNRIGQVLTYPVVLSAIDQQTDWAVTYNTALSERIVDVAVPVLDAHADTVGIIRLSYNLAEIEKRLVPLRGLVFITAAFATLVALLLAIILARSLSAPLSRLTNAAMQFVPGSPPNHLPETGPDEVRMLAISFNEVTQRIYELELGRRELLAGVVHELGNPLGAMKAAAQALQNGAVTDPALSIELAEGIVSQIDQLGLLLDDLTLLGAAALNGFTLHKQVIQIDDLLQSQARSYAYLLKQKRISLSYEFTKESTQIFADPERIRQIVSNLISNAYKYTPVGGSIQIRLENRVLDDYHWVIISISDTGAGIPLSEQKRIFSLFYRSPHIRAVNKGIGIGLALSQQLAEAHNGSLIVESSAGKGSTFILRLPAIPEGGTVDNQENNSQLDLN
ncbi:MAG: HAMP domain-containing sensor histidine kinase [Chloroflexota bacterium]